MWKPVGGARVWKERKCMKMLSEPVKVDEDHKDHLLAQTRVGCIPHQPPQCPVAIALASLESLLCMKSNEYS